LAPVLTSKREISAEEVVAFASSQPVEDGEEVGQAALEGEFETNV
jgi:hypothetical protein